MIRENGFYLNKNNLKFLPEILEKRDNIWVEIGSGNGEYITELAKRLSEPFFIATEIKFKRIQKILKKIKSKKLENVVTIHGDAAIFTEFFLKDNSIENFIINFPDPWFKKRHKKRRLINKYFYKILFKKLKNGGNIFIATDYEEYANIILNEANSTSLFHKASFCEKWLFKNIYTKYEKNFLQNGNQIFYLTLKKANQ